MKKKLSKKGKINKILEIIKKMEQNTFLLQDAWSDVNIMASRSAHYKTYVGGRGENRYINIEYIKNDELYNPKQADCYSITVRENEIFLNKRLGEVKNEVDIVLDIVEAIYKEKVSFEIMEKEVVKKRLKIKELKEQIKRNTEEFNKLKSELLNKQAIKS